MSISTHTLMIAVKATALQTQSLANQVRTAEDPELSYLEEDLSSYSKALAELKTMYTTLQANSQNLPSFDELTA